MRRNLIAAAIAVTGVLALAGCGTGGTTATSTSTGGAVSTKVPDTPMTLTVDYASDPPITPLVDGFKKLHPNIKFKLVQTPFADYQTSLKLSLSSDNPPDIVQYSPGPMRAIVPAGLVQPLDGYAKAYGWKERVSPSLLGMLTSNKSATEYGSGTLYAMPGAVQMVGVFYNKKLTSAAGITTVPETVNELGRDLAKVKRSGVTPMTLPALGVGGFQLWSALANVYGNVNTFNKWVEGVPGTSLTSDSGFSKAAKQVQDWAKDGYFSSDASALADADAIAAFSTGKAAYYVTGNWNTEAFSKALGDDVGFFLMPGTSASQAAVATGSGFPYSISAKSKHKAAAAAFLDYMSSKASAQAIFDSGFVPVIPDSSVTDEGISGTIQNDYTKVVKGKGIAPFANWATSSMIDTLTAGVQGLLSGSTTPDAYVAALQSDWEKSQQ